MTAVLFPGAIPQGSARSPRRLAWALTGSAFAHLFLASVLALDAPRPLAPRTAAPMYVRLQLDSGPPAAGASALPDASVPRSTRDAGRHAPAPERRERPAPPVQAAQAAQRASALVALPHIPDPTYYSARELDAYPRPLAPLGFDHPERSGRERTGGRILLEVLIDEHGAVREVTVVEAEPAGRFEEAARSALAAARFFPGMKHGRPVKSRLLVSVSFAAAREP